MDGTRANKKKVLAAVSSLKRALGIPNDPARPDEVQHGQNLVVYTPDPESAELLGELFHKYLTGKKAFINPPEHQDDAMVHRYVKIGLADGGGYWAGIRVVDAGLFVEGMQRIIDAHISPDIRPTGRGR